MDSSSPVVSVLTTCFNREAYIVETIESVLAQSFQDFEYIIVDDCSKDRSFEIAQSYAEKDSRIRVYRNEPNLGDYPNRNRAASFAKGRYLKYIDSDDVLYPHALDVCVRYMEMFPSAGLGLSKLHLQDQPLPILLPPRDSYREHFLGRGVFGNAPGSVIIRRNTFEHVGKFTGKRMIGDYEMWLILAAVSDVVLFPGLINWDRRHPVQESNFDPLTYATLRRDVESAALASDTCPLTPLERTAAERRIRLKSAETGVRQFVTRLSPIKSIRFIAESHCSVIDVIRAIGATSPVIRRLPLFRI